MTLPTDPDRTGGSLSRPALGSGASVGGGRFNLIRTLGQGGMGVVWLAEDRQLRESVALKYLPAELRADAVALDDLRRETQRSRRLSHPHIVRIHDFHEVSGAEAFISMEYIEGANLSALRLQQPERLFAWNCLQPLMKQLCNALDYAHGERIIHRDLKPGNMMVDARGRLKLADFGIAAAMSDSMSRVSRQQKTSGTLTYMSPQQLDGEPPRVTDDIYALGATLYELLTSKPPFYTGDIAHQVRTIPAKPLLERLEEFELRNEIPPAVSAIIMASLAKDPAQRPQSARAVGEWIGSEEANSPYETSLVESMGQRLDEAEALAVPSVAVLTELPEAELKDIAVADGRRATPVRKRLVGWLGVGAVAAILVSLGIWFHAVERPKVGPKANVLSSPQPSEITGANNAVISDRKPATLSPPQPVTVASRKWRVSIELGAGVTMEFVLIPAGSFQMGSDRFKTFDHDYSTERPVHKVTITKPFYLGVFEVTQEQWRTVMGVNPSTFKGPTRPVENVNWDDCQRFLAKFQEKSPGTKPALPTEAQWEYACRAGSTTAFSFGDDPRLLGDYAWFDGNSVIGNTGRQTHPVGQKKPNTWGLYDMHGNVWEWCSDWYTNSYPKEDATDPQGPAFGTTRVFRGGAWGGTAEGLRSARCSSGRQDRRYCDMGFRVALTEETPDTGNVR